MGKNIILQENKHLSNTFNSALEETIREGARKILQQAIECEVDEYIKMFSELKGSG
jgi:hypothetical protein